MEHTLTYYALKLFESLVVTAGVVFIGFVLWKLCKYTAKIWRIDRILREKENYE